MTRSRGLLSDLVLVRLHGRSEAYLAAADAERDGIVAACRREATVPDLAHRMLARTVYAQSASRVGPLRELLQNALDASPRGARVDVTTSPDGARLTIADRGRGMTKRDLLHDLLVPFRSTKLGDPESIGEHGIGFFSALEVAPRMEVRTSTGTESWTLRIAPLGDGPPYPDFTWELERVSPAQPQIGTRVQLELARSVPPQQVAADVAAVAGFVDPAQRRIYVDDALVNGARVRMRRVARSPVFHEGRCLGDVELYVGRGAVASPQLALTQGGLLVGWRQDAFLGHELALHRDLARATATAGFELVAELPLGVPLNKGRSAPAAHVADAVDRAIVTAFERFVLEDALYDRELLRAVDHRLAGVLDRIVYGALAGEVRAAAEDAVGELAPTRPSAAPPEPPSEQAQAQSRVPMAGTTANDGPRAPTVAAPEEVVRFATALVDAPLFTVARYDDAHEERRQPATLRTVLAAHKTGALRRHGEGRARAGTYLVVGDPLAEALWRRLAGADAAAAAPPSVGDRRARTAPVVMRRVSRAEIVAEGRALAGGRALAAIMAVLERIDAAIALAAGGAPSPIAVHMNLYGPDEMAHTDGSGISVNFASPRVRTLLRAVLAGDDPIAFRALVDLLLHEKTHVSLASYVPRSTAEHGATFYRRKDLLRRRLLAGLATGAIPDPMRWVAVLRRGLASAALPVPEELAEAFAAQSQAA